MEIIPDEKLIDSYLAGDEKALEYLFSRYLKPVYNFIFRLVGNTKESEDLSQDVFMKVWKNLSKYDKRNSFKAWIYKIARNTAIDYLRKKKTLIFSDLDEEDRLFVDNLTDNRPSPDELVMENDFKEQISDALQKIPMHYRTVMLLYYHEQLNFREISEIMGESVNTVKSRHRRGLEMLKNLLM